MWMNRDEIDMYAERLRHKPVVGRAAQLLRQYRDIVDANSDGWSTWKAGSRSASKLMELVKRGTATEAELAKAMAPIKKRCRKHGFPEPDA